MCVCMRMKGARVLQIWTGAKCDMVEGLRRVESRVAFFLFQFRGFVFITVGALKDVYKTFYSDAHVPSLCPCNLYTLTGR